MTRTSLKIVGASGQGINSIGEIVAKGAKRAGYCVFGYREYPSLIKGGHASYQIDINSMHIRSTETKVNIVISLNHHGLEHNLDDIKDGGFLLYDIADAILSDDQRAQLAERTITIIELPIAEILGKMNAKPILANVIFTACVWAILDQSPQQLKELVSEKFAKKKDLLEMNMQAIDVGYAIGEAIEKTTKIDLGKGEKKWKEQMLITGSEAMGLGAIHAGVRLYAGYPMTPSSPLLSFIADKQNETGMVIKQAEDEITAAQMMSGAMFMGTRALTGTSGGGFDLMTETVSLNGIIENPSVIVLAQRPGPATGLPTWTGQGDLFLAAFPAHGEFTHCVISVSDSQDAFDLMPAAFNIAEEYQITVIVLTDKQIAEALYTQEAYNQKKAKISRGRLITDPKLLKKLKSTDRYDPKAENGISPRWLPGSDAATYCAQGDEHDGSGVVDESAGNAIAQIEKRMKKLDALKKELPEPELFGAENPELFLIGWGSTKDAVLDALKHPDLAGKSIGYLHYTYMWPLKTSLYQGLRKTAKRTVAIEGNYKSQLNLLLKQECGQGAHDTILKYDGRPFFYEEMVYLIANQLKQL